MLKVIYYHVGKGDLSLVLMPNGDAMMIDCYKADQIVDGELEYGNTLFDRMEKDIMDHREMVSKNNLALAYLVVREKEKADKIPIAVLAITHADRDHITSRKELKKRFNIGKLIDSGRMYSDPSDTTKDYLAFRKEMKEANRYTPFNRAKYNIWPDSGAVVDILSPNRDISADENKNNQCLVIRIQYAGRSFLFTGDSTLDDWVNEESGILKLHETKIATQSLNVSHHGSRTFFTPSGPRLDGQPKYTKDEYDTRALKKISPIISFITCSDDEEADHPDPIAYECYKDETNPSLKKSGASHVILSRNSAHLYHAICTDGALYMRTSRSLMNSSNMVGSNSKPFLKGRVSSKSGYLLQSGIWVSNAPLTDQEPIKFSVEAKGKWSAPISFNWWVLNNGQGSDELHREFYTMDSKDRKNQSSWSRNLTFEGVHLMQCHATTEDEKEWANWCVLVCQKNSINHAQKWLELFPDCVDPMKINH